MWMDPKTFNIIIMSLYVVNSLWWAYHRNWPQCLYWAAAFQITFAVTWGIAR